jgi:hypothetical protein
MVTLWVPFFGQNADDTHGAMLVSPMSIAAHRSTTITRSVNGFGRWDDEFGLSVVIRHPWAAPHRAQRTQRTAGLIAGVRCVVD